MKHFKQKLNNLALITSVCLLLLGVSMLHMKAQAQQGDASQAELNSASQDIFKFEDPQQLQLFNDLAAELRCPKCQNQNLMDSQSEISIYMKQRIHEMILAGKDRQQIVDFLRQRYGDFITYNPPLNTQTALLWMFPVFLLFLCAVIFYRISKNNQLKREAAIKANSHSQQSKQDTKEQFADWLKKNTRNKDNSGSNND